MSILIKGMKMPKNCAECEISQAYDIRSTWCPLTFTTQAELKRQDHCPLIELPPHGRLIDVDALKHWILTEMACLDTEEDREFVADRLANELPTIIEAEREE